MKRESTYNVVQVLGRLGCAAGSGSHRRHTTLRRHGLGRTGHSCAGGAITHTHAPRVRGPAAGLGTGHVVAATRDFQLPIGTFLFKRHAASPFATERTELLLHELRIHVSGRRAMRRRWTTVKLVRGRSLAVAHGRDAQGSGGWESE